MLNRISFKLAFILCFVFLASEILAVNVSGDNVWREVDDSNFKNSPAEKFVSRDNYKTFRLNNYALKAILLSAPQEYNTVGVQSGIILTIPMPDGSFEKFSIKESPIMETALAEKFPEIKTYLGQGIDNPTATMRLSITQFGFHGMILSDQGTIYINPHSAKDTNNYISFNKGNLGRNPNPFVCEVGVNETPIEFKTPEYKLYSDASNVVTNGTTLRQYRLALAATNEYAVAVGGNTIAGTLAAQVVVMNRVNGVYERELAVRMNIIGTNNLIIYAGDNLNCSGACTAANDPYTNSSGGTMLGQNQTTLTSVIGSANYDIGHVFSTGGGGVASLQSPCNAATKARGVTGLPNPVGDPFAIDFVAHEIGHQYGGNHPFNGSTGNCSGTNRNGPTAYEPGSGSTIQAYAGICSPQDLQLNSNDYFHVVSLEEMVAFTNNVATGGSCSANSATGNLVPAVSVVGGPAFNVPQGTPFTLTASGTDGNFDPLTFNWEEYDLGPQGGPSASVNAPVFRSYLATTSPSRTFPSLQYILNNNNIAPATYNCSGFTCIVGEFLPTITRTMTFQVTARDNRAGGGGVNSTTATVAINVNSGPFKVTAQDSLIAPNWQAGTMQTVTWDVAGTTGVPINAANVNILLSTDGGLTFPTTLAANTPNDGTQAITVPNLPTTLARLKVEGAGNIFFDISNVNFTITAPTAANASVSGRVVNSSGRGLSRVTVMIQGAGSSQNRSVITNPFGYFSITDLPVGNFYVLSVAGKGYEFPNNTQTFTLDGDLNDVIFVGNSQ